MASILPVESKRRKLSDQVARSVPYLHDVTMCYRNVFAIGREGNVVNFALEGDVMKNCPFAKVNK